MRSRVDPHRAVSIIGRSCAAAPSAHELLARVSHDLHDLVPHDGSTWFGADPVTLLPASPTRVEGFEGASCGPYWQREFHEQDVSLFVDLARDPEPVAALRIVMDGRPGRSSRFRDLIQPHGYDDELRGALRLGSTTWGLFGLYRDKGRRPFDLGDVAVMRATAPVIATHLRDHVRAQGCWLGVAQAPGLMMVDTEARVLSANAEARLLLRELHIAPDGTTLPLDLGALDELVAPDEWHIHVGTPLFALVSRARAVANGFDGRPARLRLRDSSGRWLLLHASCMTGLADRSESVAVVIEPAMSAEIAPIIIEAYSLTPRERDVLGALARGRSTSEIAATLFLSQHTVRDHIKTVFDKVGVSSRAELVARLFAEHYDEPAHAELVARLFAEHYDEPAHAELVHVD